MMEPQARKRSSYNPRIPVFNPSNRRRSIQCFGTMYDFEPRGLPHCICATHVASGDTEGIHEAFDWERDDMNRLLTSIPPKVTATANQVADHICSQDLMGGLGFVKLEGSFEEQEEQKLEATARWSEFRRGECEDLIGQWEAFCAEHARARPGQAPPRRPKNIQEAFKDRGALEQGEGRAAFICPACSEEANQMEVMDAHMKQSHPGLVGVAPIHAPTARPAAPHIEPIVRIQPSQVRAAERISARAKEAGVALTIADQKGLEHGDPDVIEDVIMRVRSARDAVAVVASDDRPATPAKEAAPEEAAKPEKKGSKSGLRAAVTKTQEPEVTAG